MKIIISPAKRMKTDNDNFQYHRLPVFIDRAEELMETLRAMSYQDLKALWRCNDSIARLNVERLAGMDLMKNLTPAIIAFDGIQYKYMAPGVFEEDHFDFVEDHLRILSGFYGILRPFDGVVPYRLEMQAGLSVNGHKDLYKFWGDRIAKQIFKGADFILNLASKEYSLAITRYLPKNIRFLTCTFGVLIGNRVTQRGTLCKMARGQMVRWLAENNIESAEDIKAFDNLGYNFSKEYSTKDNYVFISKTRQGGIIDGGNKNPL